MLSIYCMFPFYQWQSLDLLVSVVYLTSVGGGLVVKCLVVCWACGAGAVVIVW